ncbi:hypothetical protein H5W18_06535 [Lactobacillus sp. Marseille-P7033]|nr:hypothetical protein [Lactobacillus sp. Marseille-P7033]NGC78325.1 hypothetical protein [Limosilactobacillus reuteri]
MYDTIDEAKVSKILAAQSANRAKEALEQVINWFSNLMMILVVELGVIIGTVLVLPSWWKLVGLIITVIGSVVFNRYLKGGNDNGIQS